MIKKDKFSLDVLENTEKDIVEKIAEFPVSDDSAKERIFRISERRYNEKNINNSENHYEDIVSGTDVYITSRFKQFLTVASVILVVAGAVAGNVFLIKNFGINDDIETASEVTTETTKAIETTQTDTNVFSFDADFSPINTNSPLDDFAENPYYIPDYKSDINTSFRCGNENIDIYSGEMIPYEKRSKISEFFSSQTWVKSENINISSEPKYVFCLYFDSEYKEIKVYENNQLKCVSHKLKFNPEADLYECTSDSSNCWYIDYKLFSEHIADVLD